MISFTAKNLGPLVEGTVELRPLTIFVGPSNTGKSYMASAIYATAMAAGAFPHFYPVEEFSEKENTGAAVKFFQEWANQQGAKELPVSELPMASIPQDVRDWVKGSSLQRLISLRSKILSQLRQLHGKEPGFVRQGSEPGDFQLHIQRQTPMLRLKVQLSDNLAPLPEFDMSQIVLTKSQVDLMSQFFRIAEDNKWSLPRIDDYLSALATQGIFLELSSQSHYLPAARSGIVQWHKVLAAALTRQSRRIGLEPMNIPSLPGTATEFLGNLIELDKSTARRSGFTNQLASATDFIETSVLGGKVDLDESAGLPAPEIVYLSEKDGAATGKFILEHTSSMVSELAPLILFLKYRVNPGDLLILEEPESHLHPAAQLRMARGIARLVNAGVRVLITTHSSDFMGQIDNLISLSNVDQKTAESLGLELEECLRPEQVSAYGFHIDAARGGSVATPLPVGSDVGIEDQEFLPVSELLYEQAITLQRSRLE